MLVEGPARSPRVIDRRAIELSDPRVPTTRQPYHAVRDARPGQAAKLERRLRGDLQDGWEDLIPGLVRLSGNQVGEFAGAGELITDDRPLPEYFLLKRANGPRYEWLKPDLIRPPG